jgi:hypothetical protein
MPRNGYPYFVLGADRSRPGQDEQAGLLNFRSMSSLKDKRASIMEAIKCLKGVQWMPWHQEAMKDVVRCDKPWGGANNL